MTLPDIIYYETTSEGITCGVDADGIWHPVIDTVRTEELDGRVVPITGWVDVIYLVGGKPIREADVKDMNS